MINTQVKFHLHSTSSITVLVEYIASPSMKHIFLTPNRFNVKAMVKLTLNKAPLSVATSYIFSTFSDHLNNFPRFVIRLTYHQSRCEKEIANRKID